jgi:hypothetical protein
VKDEGGAGAAEVLTGEVAAFPDFFAGFAIEGGGAVAAEVEVDVIGIDGGGAGAVAIDVVAERFGIGVFEEEEVVEFLAGGFVEADGEHFFTIGSGIGDPDLLAHDDGGGPGAAGDGGFPDDVFCFGPFGGKAVGFAIGAGWVEAIVVGATKGGPVGEGGEDEGEEKEDESHDWESVEVFYGDGDDGVSLFFNDSFWGSGRKGVRSWLLAFSVWMLARSTGLNCEWANRRGRVALPW